MRAYRLYIVLMSSLLSLLMSVQCFGQDEEGGDFDTYIAELNAQCPILDGDNWSINSFTVQSDTVQVELLVPTNLSMFLSMLTSKNDNVRRLWFKQLLHYGDSWSRFVDRMIATKRTLVLVLRPKDTDTCATVMFTPAHLVRFVEEE